MNISFDDDVALILFEDLEIVSVFAFSSHRDSPTQPGYLMLESRSYLGERWKDKIPSMNTDILTLGSKTYHLDESGLADTLISQALLEYMSDEPSVFGSRSGVVFNDYSTKEGESLILPHGVVALYGVQGSGKSSLAYQMHRMVEDKSSFISFGEPDLISTANMGAIAKMLNTSLFSLRKELVFLDSARSFLFSPSSSTGAGGVNNEIFVMLSKISSSLAKLRKTLVLTFNPMSLDKDVLEATLDGSVSAIIRSDLGNGFSMRSRLHNDRKLKTFLTTASNSGVARIESVSHNIKGTAPSDPKSKGPSVLAQINKFLLGD